MDDVSLDDIDFEKLIKSMSSIKKVAEMARDDALTALRDSTPYDEYFRGMANGLALAESIFFDKPPKYIDPCDRTRSGS